jgi:hypothetical protein
MLICMDITTLLSIGFGNGHTVVCFYHIILDKVKQKCSLCIIKYQALKMCMGVVTFVTLVIDGDEWPSHTSDTLLPGESPLAIWVGRVM